MEINETTESVGTATPIDDGFNVSSFMGGGGIIPIVIAFIAGILLLNYKLNGRTGSKVRKAEYTTKEEMNGKIVEKLVEQLKNVETEIKKDHEVVVQKQEEQTAKVEESNKRTDEILQKTDLKQIGEGINRKWKNI